MEAPLPAAVETLASVKECRQFTSDAAKTEILGARLSPDVELWGVPCSVGTDVNYDLFLTGPNGSNPRKIALPNSPFSRVSEADAGSLAYPVYDPDTRVLSHVLRYRGFGDCGAAQSWTWTSQGFVLKEERYMYDCRRIYSELWPTTWRTR